MLLTTVQLGAVLCLSFLQPEVGAQQVGVQLSAQIDVSAKHPLEIMTLFHYLINMFIIYVVNHIYISHLYQLIIAKN